MMLDIDKFKKINDNFGHLAGDYILKKVCSIINEQLGQNDITARYGGEEFIMLLPGSDHETAMKTAESICSGIREYPYEFEGKNMDVTVSIGVFTPKFPLTGTESIDDFIAAVDFCLYHAKKQGRNRTYGKTERQNK